MGLINFKKSKLDKELQNKEEEMKKDTQGSSVNKALYKVHIYDKVSGSTPRHLKTIDCYRTVDDDSSIDFLENEDNGFYEVFPQTDENFNEENKDNIKEKLDTIKNKLQLEKEKEEPSINFRDLESEIKKLEARYRSTKFSKNNSYVSIGDSNKFEFHYLRVGTNFIPLKWDLETKTIYVPDDNKKKSANIVLRNKESKYPNLNNQVKLSTWVLFIVSLLLLAGNMYIGYKNINAYSETEINKIKEDFLTTNAEIVKQTEAQAKTLTDLTTKFSDQLKPDEVIVVQGKETRTFNNTK